MTACWISTTTKPRPWRRSSQNNPVRIELQNSIEELATAISALEEFAVSSHLDEAAAQAAEVVLDEMLSNIIRYGQVGPGLDPIILELYLDAGSLVICISDCGMPYNPFDRPPPDLDLPLEEREPGGLGVHLVKNLMDQCDYEYRDERNVVTMRKALAR